jgi:hypothetical protein
MTVGLPFLGCLSISSFYFREDDGKLTILGFSSSLEVTGLFV